MSNPFLDDMINYLPGVAIHVSLHSCTLDFLKARLACHLGVEDSRSSYAVPGSAEPGPVWQNNVELELSA